MAKSTSPRSGGTVLFCGAGVSVPVGYPVTNQIFSLIVNDITDERLFGDYDTGQHERDRLKELLFRLFPTAKNGGASPNCLSICSVLSLIDHMANAKLIPIPDWQTDDLQDLQLLLEQAIAWVIERKKLRTKEAIEFKRGTAEFIDRQSRRANFTVITTNYDIWIENLLFAPMSYSPAKVAARFDFGFAWRRASNGKLKVFNRPSAANRTLGWFKLHGSFNWLRCELCGQIYINTYGSIVELSLLKGMSQDTMCHCGRFPLRPLLVSPSFVRDVRDSNLLEIWRHSLEALRTADEWIFVGYSFPEEDYMIRAMLLRAYNGWERTGGQKKPHVRIISRPPPAPDSPDAKKANSDFAEMQARALAVLPSADFERIGAEGLFLGTKRAQALSRQRMLGKAPAAPFPPRRQSARRAART